MDKWLRNHNVVRVIAFALAILLWVVVHLDEQQRSPGSATDSATSMEIDDFSIELVGLDETKYTIVSVTPQDVRLRVRGSSNALRSLNPLHAKVTASLSGVVSGEQVVKLSHSGFPNGLDVDITPDRVSIVVEEKLNKEMPVTIRVDGEPQPGLVAGSPIIQPNRAFVTLPASLMDQIDAVVGVVNVSNATETFSNQVKLVAYNKNGEPMEQAEISPQVADVEIQITQPFKVLPLRVNYTGTPALGYSVSGFQQSVQQVTVYGTQQALSELEVYGGLTVDISGLSESKTFMLDIPLRNEVSRIDPPRVEVRLDLVGATRRTFENVPVAIGGVPEQYEAVFADPESGALSITLEGAPDAMASLKPEDIDLVVDVGNLPVGRHEVTVSYSLPSYVKVVQNGPITVVLDIVEATEE